MQRRSSKEEAPFPWRQCIVLALCNAAHFYTICSLFSYAGFLVVDLGWSPNVDEAGYVAGYLGSALVVGRLFTSVLWGRLADAFGRKPAILLSMAGILVGNLAFGITKTLHAALIVRAIFLGACNGWVSLMGVYVGEVGGASRQNRVNGYTLTGGTFCQLSGPAVAALLYNKIPRYPALAPSLLGACLALVAMLLGSVWLTETKAPGYARVGDAEEPDVRVSSDVHSILFAKGVFLRFALGFATFAAFDTIPLWAIASLKAGGLDLTRADLAITLTVASGVQVLYSFRFMASFMEGRGLRGSLVTAACAGASTLMFIPILGGLVAPFGVKLLFLAIPVTVFYAAATTAFSAAQAIVNNVVRSAERGYANGVAATVEAVGKAAGPTFGAVVLATGFSSNHGGFAAFWCLASSLLLAVAVARKLPESVEKSLDDELATIEMTRRKEVGFDEGQDAWDAKLGKRDSEPVLAGLDDSAA